MTDLHYDYIVESREHLATFEQSLLALEKAPDRQAVRVLVEDGLRAIHSFKGDSGFLGFVEISRLAHAIENVLDDYRTGTDGPGPDVVESLLAARDLLLVQLEDLEHPRFADNAQMIARLEPLAVQAAAETPVDLSLSSWLSKNPKTSVLDFFRTLEQLGTWQNPQLEIHAHPLSQDSWHQDCDVRLRGSLRSKKPFQFLQAWLAGDLDASDKLKNTLDTLPCNPAMAPKLTDPSAPAAVHYSLTEWHANKGSLMALFRDMESKITQPELVFAEVGLREGLPKDPVEWRASSLLTLRNQEALTEPIAVPILAASEIEVARSTALNNPIVDDITRQDALPLSSRPTANSERDRLRSLRINVDLLDRMMNLIGELTLVRNQTLVTFEGAEGESRNIIQRLNSVTSELQDTVLQTRMQPVGTLFGRFPRMVRDLARQLGKEVEIITVGEEVELDKTVLERLSDPLTHLIRNSIDHGIELPEVREAAGKSRIGRITLTATPADGQVCIEIRDDGRGIDSAAIKSKAVAMRIRSQTELERLSNRELYSLILLPGFSTAQKLTDVSGRGVGMDVVRTNVEELEGSLTIDSWLGQGTSMQLRVPLTLAIVPCLIVTVGEERFAVPQRALDEIVCLHANGKWVLEQSIDGEVMRLRNALIPVVRFSELLSRPRPFTPKDKEEILRSHSNVERDRSQIEYILVLRSAGRRFGLLVDRVLGREEIVIKPMHATLKPISVFSGATLMGDGRVALIANVDGILEHAACPGAKAEEVPKSTIRDPHEVHRVLLFEHGPNEQFAIPIVQIQRVELLDTKRIERIGTTEFADISGKSTRILRLSDMLQVSTCEDLPTMFLILPKFIPEPMGILATRIIDTESLAIDLQSNGCERGVLGTARVRNRLSLFLDVQQLREFVFGTSKEANYLTRISGGKENASPVGSLKQRILLVDDTTFFREIVKRYLSSDDVEVLTAIDGKHGLEMLAQHAIDLVVSDIEMPVMDGWQFCKAARDRGYRMPFVALTSLAKIENEERAMSCGFDDFEEKLDHDRLRGKIQFWLSRKQEGALSQ